MLFNLHALDFDYRPEAPTPKLWLKFLASLWPDDEQAIATLQEWMGYLLSCDTSFQKILLVVGPRRGGKGTIARVVMGLINPGNAAAPTLNSLTTNFGLMPLIGKQVAIISDARLSGRADQSELVERLLSISGEDHQTIDRKHLSQITLRLPTRIMIMTNRMPRSERLSSA